MSKEFSAMCETEKNAYVFDRFSRDLHFFHMYFENQFTFETLKKFYRVDDDINVSEWQKKNYKWFANPLEFFHILDYSAKFELITDIMEYAKKEQKFAIEIGVLETEQEYGADVTGLWSIGKFMKYIHNFHIFFENRTYIDFIDRDGEFSKEIAQIMRMCRFSKNPMEYFNKLDCEKRKILYTAIKEEYNF